MQHVYQYQSDHEISYEDIDATVRNIAHDVIRSIIQNSNTTDRKEIAQQMRKYEEFNAMQSSVTNSVGVKIRRFISQRTSSKTEKKLFFIFTEKLSSIILFAMSLLPAVEYYIEGSLLLAYYNASKTYTGVREGFSLAPFFGGFFYVNLTVMLLSYICSVTLGSLMMPVKANICKMSFYMSRLVFPLYFPIIKAVHNLKVVFCKKQTFEIYHKGILIDKEYAKIRCMFVIPKICLENIPQLIFALLLFFSDPLKKSVLNDNNSPFKSFRELAIINVSKSFISLILVSSSFATYLNVLKNFTIGIQGRVTIALSNMAFIMSRVCGIMFCLFFSSYHPDLQFYLFYLAQARTFTLRGQIPPNVIEELYQATISPAPGLFVLVTL